MGLGTQLLFFLVLFLHSQILNFFQYHVLGRCYNRISYQKVHRQRHYNASFFNVIKNTMMRSSDWQNELSHQSLLKETSKQEGWKKRAGKPLTWQMAAGYYTKIPQGAAICQGSTNSRLSSAKFSCSSTTTVVITTSNALFSLCCLFCYLWSQ